MSTEHSPHKENEPSEPPNGESALLRECLDRFPTLEERVETLQLCSMQLKYQYFLRKYQKYVEEHGKYKEQFANIEKTIEESGQIRDENRSIEFIKKIMEDTEKKYQVLSDNIDSLRSQKQQTKHHMEQLKHVLLRIKREYFELERTHNQLTSSLADQQQQAKQAEVHRNMFKIRVDKRNQREYSMKNKPVPLQTSTSWGANTVGEQLQQINRIKQQFLGRIGINLDEYYKINERSYDLQANYNHHLLKKDVQAKVKAIGQLPKEYQPHECGVEIFRLAQRHEKEKEDFMRMTNQDIIELVVKKNKVGEVLGIIEEEKRQIIAEYQLNKNRQK